MNSSTKNDASPVVMTRRTVLSGIGLAFVTAPLGQLLACSSDDKGSGTGAAAWAIGGTAAMTAASTYPDPFASGLGTTCKLTCEQILGPCYAVTLKRKDISEGQKGLPVRLALLVVDESCKPIQGATVDIWHTGPNGLYSGEDASTFCTHDDAEAVAGKWFRGVQTTDAKGRVDFDTCFPGWYGGRALHIHFTIKIGEVEYVSSQFYFEDALGDEIMKSQALYSSRGERDTKNTNDLVIKPELLADATLQTKRMSDGAMLAWKAIVIRSSVDTPLCSANSDTIGELQDAGVDFNDPSTFPDGGLPGGG